MLRIACSRCGRPLNTPMRTVTGGALTVPASEPTRDVGLLLAGGDYRDAGRPELDFDAALGRLDRSVADNLPVGPATRGLKPDLDRRVDVRIDEANVGLPGVRPRPCQDLVRAVRPLESRGDIGQKDARERPHLPQ